MSSTRRRRGRFLPALGRDGATALLAASTTMAGLALLAGATALAASPAAAKRPNLQGTWKLNPELTAQVNKDQAGSEPAEDKESGGKGHHKQGGGDWGGGGMPGGGMPGDGLPGGGKGHGSGTPAAADGGHEGGSGQEHRGAAFDALTIAQAGDQLTITDHLGSSLAVKADGSKVHVAAAPGGAAQVKARWDEEGALAVEVKPDKGPKRTESYLVSNDGKHLYLTVTTGGGMGGAQHATLRAYDRAPDPPNPPNPQNTDPAPAPPPAQPPGP